MIGERPNHFIPILFLCYLWMARYVGLWPKLYVPAPRVRNAQAIYKYPKCYLVSLLSCSLVPSLIQNHQNSKMKFAATALLLSAALVSGAPTSLDRRAAAPTDTQVFQVCLHDLSI
jgi:hypothetical protein